MTDQRTIDIVRASAAYRAVDATLRALEAAWRSSSARAAMSRVAPHRVRFWSIAALTASATVLLLAPLGSDPRPLAWLVPAIVGGVALLILSTTSR